LANITIFIQERQITVKEHIGAIRLGYGSTADIYG